MKIKEFENYLKKKRKRGTGDKLLSSTIEAYIYYARRIFKSGILEDTSNISKIIDWMNRDLRINPQTVLYNVYRNVLYAASAEKKELEDLKFTTINHTALKSVRFLQSKIFSKKEVRQLLGRVKDNQEKLLFKIFIDTGARRREIMRAKVKDISWRTSDLSFISVLGKGGKRREVYIQKTTEKMLKYHIKTMKLKSDDRILTLLRKDGNPIGISNPDTFLRAQEQACYDLFVKYGTKYLDRHMHPHAFRHSMAQGAADSGMDILDIAAMLGHEHVATTEIYAHASTRRRKLAFEKIKDVSNPIE